MSLPDKPQSSAEKYLAVMCGVAGATKPAIPHGSMEQYLDYLCDYSGATWGNIRGTLSNQTDLNNALSTRAHLVNGKVPLNELPEYIIADIETVANYSDLPATGDTNVLYYVTSTQTTYRWVGSTYIQVNAKNQYFSRTLDSATTTMAALKSEVDDINLAGDHAFFDLHAFISEGYVCTVHFFTDSNNVERCEINDLLGAKMYGNGKTYDSTTTIASYITNPEQYTNTIENVSFNGTTLTPTNKVVTIPTETWTFTMSDGTTVSKVVSAQ